MKPMNGVKTHPLTVHALAALRDIADKPCPRQELNPGVANRLLREELVESVMRPSPFRTHAGRPLEHLRITEAGRRAAGFSPATNSESAAPSQAIWNCWTRNYSAWDMGVITHAFDEYSEQYRRHYRALCGVGIHDTGLVALGEEGWRPGCKKCCRILVKRGLLLPGNADDAQSATPG